MKLFALLLLAIAALALAASTQELDAIPPDAVEVDPGVAVGNAQSSKSWPFSWSTTEYCENGVLRATGTFTVKGFQHTFKFDGVTTVYVKVFNEALRMTYNFERFYTDFQYGPNCKWGILSRYCGQCDNVSWNGTKLDCLNGDTGATRSRSDRCWLTYWLDSAQSAQDKLPSIAPREQTERIDTNTIDTPDSPLIFDITVDPNPPAAAALPPPTPGFWNFQLNITEGYDRGQAYADGDFLSVGGYAKFVFRDNGKFMWAKVNEKYLHMQYDFKNHWANFAYDGYRWGMDAYGASVRGMCTSRQGWNKPPLPDQSQDTRTTALKCWIYLWDLPTRGIDEKANDVVARELTAVSDTVPVIPTATQALDTPHNASVGDRIGYYAFTLSLTEYCEASEGTPLMARGWWSPKGSTSGLKVKFHTDRMVTSLNLGYPGINLLVGPYDYYTHRVGFHYGGCHWDQDVKGMGKCGYCSSTPWSSNQLNCAQNPAASRSHGIACMVAVQWENAASQNQSQALAARKEVEVAVTGNEVQAAGSRTTLTFDVIATQTAATATSMTTILPFHFTLTEVCENGKMYAKGLWVTGSIQQPISLWPGLIISIIHRVPNFPPIQVGAYDYNHNRLRYGYSNGPVQCEWYDDETWKSCGECRAALWSGPPLDCAAGGFRTKEMDCSFILGN